MIIKSAEGKADFQDVYNTFSGQIRRYLARLSGGADSEDVTKEVFVKVNAALSNFRCEASLSTCIYRIATNAAMDHLRKSSRLKLDDSQSGEDSLNRDETAVDPGAPAVEARLVRKEMNECIRRIVEGLPENYRTVLILSDLEDMTNQEVAEVLDISLDTVKIRLHRARARLKKELEEHCIFYRDDRNELACDRKTPPIIL
jgi:RNA polymerase sigma-70 factor, ECF subfamily